MAELCGSTTVEQSSQLLEGLDGLTTNLADQTGSNLLDASQNLLETTDESATQEIDVDFSEFSNELSDDFQPQAESTFIKEESGPTVSQQFKQVGLDGVLDNTLPTIENTSESTENSLSVNASEGGETSGLGTSTQSSVSATTETFSDTVTEQASDFKYQSSTLLLEVMMMHMEVN